MYKKLLIPHIFPDDTQAFYKMITYQILKKLFLSIELKN